MTLQKVGVYGFVLNDKKEILIVKRADHDSNPGMWELPGGGVELDEEPKNAVIREVREEAGLTVNALHPFSVVSHTTNPKRNEQVFRIAYLCTLTSISQSVQLSNEHSDFKWIRPSDAINSNSSEFLAKIFSDYAVFTKN